MRHRPSARATYREVLYKGFPPLARRPEVRTMGSTGQRTLIVFRSPGVGIGKDAHHDPTRPHEQHAILRHDVSIAPGLRDAGGDLIGHRVQLDPGRHLGPDIRVEGGERLTLDRLADGVARLLSYRLEGVGNCCK